MLKLGGEARGNPKGLALTCGSVWLMAGALGAATSKTHTQINERINTRKWLTREDYTFRAEVTQQKIMHVTTGSAKGRKIISVDSDGTRPITDKVKQALFNILGDDVRDSAWLDLFGGTGAVGIEALSRGARSVTFVDNASIAVKTIQTNLKNLMLDKQSRAIRQDAFAYLGGHPNARYDFVYIAPPQYHGLWTRALLLLDQNVSWLNEGGCAIVQIDPIEFAEPMLNNLELTDQRKYGKTMLCFYDLKANNV